MCEINKPDTKVKWMLNGQRLVANENVQMISDEGKRILRIKKCDLTDSGKISCVLPGNKSSEGILTVEEVPIVIQMESIEVFEKEDAKFEATLSKSIPKRETSWTFNANKLNESIKYNMESSKDGITHKLNLRECTLEDSGPYTINVRNDKLTVQLLVKG